MSTEVGVSVVVAARDAAATIAGQVAAVLGQCCDRRWELVVVDDGSVDATGAAADGAAAGAPGYRRVSLSVVAGASGARRAGVDAASGELLVFCDADDLVGPGWLQALVDASGRFDVVGGYCDDRILNPVRVRRRRPAQPVDGLPVGVGGVRFALGANLAIGRGAYEAIGGWDPTLGHGTDLDLCLRAQAAGFTLGSAPGAVVAYRHRVRWADTIAQSYRWGRADATLAARHAPALAGVSRRRAGPVVRRLLAGQDSLVRLGAFGVGRAVGAWR